MAHVILVGCGNIGSHLAPHLARMKGVDRITLIDKGRYDDERILAGQAIDRCELGKPKASAQAARLRRINPALHLAAVSEAVERLPLGALRCDLLLSCLDSRIARMRLNQSLWRLGIPWVDAGVNSGGLLARVNAYLPAAGSPCLECSWSDRDYQALENVYACSGGMDVRYPTNAPSSLGALAASLQTIEAQKFLSGRPDQVIFGRQVLIDAAHHKHYVTRFRRNPRCRFDHKLWHVEELPLDIDCSLRQVLDLFNSRTTQEDEVSLSVEGKLFLKRLVCACCGRSRPLLRLRDSLRPKDRICAACNSPLLPAGWDLLERIPMPLPGRDMARPLSAFGFRHGEIFTIVNSIRERHFEIAPAARETPATESGCGQSFEEKH